MYIIYIYVYTIRRAIYGCSAVLTLDVATMATDGNDDDDDDDYGGGGGLVLVGSTSVIRYPINVEIE